MNQTEQQRRAWDMHRKAMLYGDYVLTRNGKMAFQWELAGPSGARFQLLPEPHHTQADVRYAQYQLKHNRDVVGRVGYFKLKAEFQQLV